MSDEFDYAKLLIVRNKFLCCVPVGEIGLKEHLKGISWTDQALLLDSTVNSVLLQEYPVRISYQKAFLKLLIQVLEQNCDEVHDIVYDTYCVLLNTVDEAKYSYKHYCIEDRVITLKENRNFISEGTTGLCSWQAALALSEYCLINKHHLQRRTVLELGAGVGLVGITVALHCQPRAIYLTDCHPKVLAVLAENVSLNLTANPHTITPDSIDTHTVKQVDSSAQRVPLNCHTVKETVSARFDSIPTGNSSQLEHRRESDNRYTVKETVSARFDSIPVANSPAPSPHTITETLRRCGFDSSVRESPYCHTVKDAVQQQVQLERASNTSDKCVRKLDDSKFDQKFDSSSCVLVHTVRATDTRVCVLNLPWESVDDIECCSRIVPDLILAADVVYDSSVFQPLCATVKYFVNSNAKCQVIFACTERNTSTLNEFMKLLETNHFNIRELSPPESKYFYWSTEIPIRFFTVTAL
ncbi:uncharacterized protein CBL_09836 [Carabus blaptoides fortunei]